MVGVLSGHVFERFPVRDISEDFGTALSFISEAFLTSNLKDAVPISTNNTSNNTIGDDTRHGDGWRHGDTIDESFLLKVRETCRRLGEMGRSAREKKPLLIDPQRDMGAVSSYIFEETRKSVQMLQTMTESEVAVFTCKIAEPNTAHYVTLVVSKCHGQTHLRCLDINPVSEHYRTRTDIRGDGNQGDRKKGNGNQGDRKKGDGNQGDRKKGDKQREGTYVSSLWRCVDEQGLKHSSFFAMLYILGCVPSPQNMHALYTVILPSVATRVYHDPEFTSMIVPPALLTPTRGQQPWRLALFTSLVALTLTIRMIRGTAVDISLPENVKSVNASLYGLMEVEAAEQSDHVVEAFTTFIYRHVLSAAREKFSHVDSPLLSRDLQTLGIMMSRVLSREAETWFANSPLYGRRLLEVCKACTKLGSNILPWRADPLACELRNPPSLMHPLFGMLSHSRTPFLLDAPRNVTGHLITRPDLTAPFLSGQAKDSATLLRVFMSLVETLGNLEFQRHGIKHAAWLQFSLVESFLIQTVPLELYGQLWTLGRLKQSEQKQLLWCVQETARFLVLCTARTAKDEYKACELIGFTGTKNILFAALLALANLVLATPTADSLAPASLVFQGHTATRSTISRGFTVRMHGLAEATAVTPITHAKLLLLRMHILDGVYKERDRLEIFAFDLLGTQMAETEAEFMLGIANVLGLIADSPNRANRAFDFLNDDESYLTTMIPELLYLRNIAFLTKYGLNASGRQLKKGIVNVVTATPRWRYDGQTSAWPVKNFKVTFFGKSGRSINRVLAARIHDTGVAHLTPSLHESDTPGTFSFGDLKTEWSELRTAYIKSGALKTSHEASVTGLSSAFTAISKYVSNALWENEATDDHSTIETSASPSSILSVPHVKSLLLQQAVDQAGVEQPWQPIGDKIASAIQHESQVLTLKLVPLISQYLSAWEVEVFMSILSAPYVRISSLLAFLGQGEHLWMVTSPYIQSVIWTALFEPGSFKNSSVLEEESKIDLTPPCVPCRDNYDKLFYHCTRIGLMMNEIIFNGANLVALLTDLLRLAADKDTGRLDLSQNVPVLALGFLALISAHVASFALHLASSTLPFTRITNAFAGDSELLRGRVKSCGRSLINILKAEVAPVLRSLASKASTAKKIQTVLFCRSVLVPIHMIAATAETSVLQSAEALFYVLAHRPFSAADSTFEVVVEDPVEDTGAGSDSEESTMGETFAKQGDLIMSASAFESVAGLPLPQLFRCLTSVRLPLIVMCENLSAPWVVPAGKTAQPGKESTREESEKIVVSRNRVCDAILSAVIEGEEKEVDSQQPAVETPGNALRDIGFASSESMDSGIHSRWEIADSVDLRFPLRGLTGCFWGLYSCSSGKNNAAVQLDLQLGEISFLQKGFQVLGDWAYKNARVRQLIAPGRDHPVLHCATVLSSTNMTHVRLISLQPYDLIRCAPMTNAFVSATQVDNQLAERASQRLVLRQEIEALKEEGERRGKKGLDTTQKKTLKTRIAQLEALNQPLTAAEWDAHVLTPQHFVANLWSGSGCDRVSTWKVRAQLDRIPFFEASSEDSSTSSLGGWRSVRRWLFFLEWVGRDGFKALPYDKGIHVENVRELIYHIHNHLIEVFEWISEGTCVYRHCVYASDRRTTYGLLSPEPFALPPPTPAIHEVSSSPTIFGALGFEDSGDQDAETGPKIQRTEPPTEAVWLAEPSRREAWLNDLACESVMGWDVRRPQVGDTIPTSIASIALLIQSAYILQTLTSHLTLMVPERILEGLVPSVLAKRTWWQSLPALTTCLGVVRQRLSEKDTELSAGIKSVWRHLLTSKSFAESMATLEDPFSIMRSDTGEDSLRIYVLPPIPSKTEVCKSRVVNIASFGDQTWFDRPGGNVLSVSQGSILSSALDGLAIVQKKCPTSNNVYTLIESRSLLQNTEFTPTLQALLRLDDLEAICVWTTDMPDLSQVIREVKSDLLNVIVDAIAQHPPSDTSPAVGTSACTHCNGATLLLQYISTAITEKISALQSQNQLRVALVEIPRLDLTFRGDQQGRLYCDQHDGFFVSPRLYGPDTLTATLLGSLQKTCLLLESHGGSQILLSSARKLPYAVKGHNSEVPRPPLVIPLSDAGLNGQKTLLQSSPGPSIHSPSLSRQKPQDTQTVDSHFVFKIHSCKSLLYSSDGQSLFALFLHRLAAAEYAPAAALLRSGSLIQFLRVCVNQSESTAEESPSASETPKARTETSLNMEQNVNFLLWSCLNSLASDVDGHHPDGIGLRVRLLVAVGAFAASSKSAAGQVACLSKWDGVKLYEKYVRRLHVVAESSRLSVEEEQTIVDCVKHRHVTVSPLVLLRKLCLDQSRTDRNHYGAIQPIHVYANAFVAPGCAFDLVDPETAKVATLTGRLWDSLQSVQGFIMAYRKPPQPLSERAAVEFILRFLTAKTASSGVSDYLGIKPNGLEFSLSRDWLALYDLLTDGVSLAILPSESSHQWGVMLSRFIARSDIMVSSKLSGILRYLALNHNFALTVAPKYDPETDSRESQSSANRLTTRLGVTLRTDVAVKRLFDRIEHTFTSSIPPSSVPLKIASASAACLDNKITFSVSRLLELGHWSTDPTNKVQRTEPLRRRIVRVSEEESVDRFRSPFKHLDVCRQITNPQESRNQVLFDVDGKFAPLVRRMQEEVIKWNAKDAKSKANQSTLVFLREPIRDLLESPSKCREVCDQMEALRVRLAMIFRNDGEKVKTLTASLLSRANGLRESISPHSTLKNSASGLSNSVGSFVMGDDSLPIDSLGLEVGRENGLKLSLGLASLTELLQSVSGVSYLSSFSGISEEEADGVLALTATLIMHVCRRSLVTDALSILATTSNFFKTQLIQFENGDALENLSLKCARIEFHVKSLVDVLNYRSEYIHEQGDPAALCPTCGTDKGLQSLDLGMASSESNFRMCYDTQMLVYEFANALRLRSRQVELVKDVISSVQHKESLCTQLMMGQGKTTVIAPLLSCVLSTPTQLVLLVVPSRLVNFSRKSLEDRFAAVLQRPVYVFDFTRYKNVTADLVKEVKSVQDCRGVVVTSPTSVKSVYLKFILLLSILWKEPFMETVSGDNWSVQRRKALKTLMSLRKMLHKPKLSVSYAIGLHSIRAGGTEATSTTVTKGNNRTLFGDLKNVMGRVQKMTLISTPSVSPSVKRVKRGTSFVTEKSLKEDVLLVEQELNLCVKLLDIFASSALIIDEVDTVMHPQKSELRWPVGNPQPVHLSQPTILPFTKTRKITDSRRSVPGLRWCIAWHVLEILMTPQTGRTKGVCECHKFLPDCSTHVGQSREAEEEVKNLQAAVALGVETKQCLLTPHLLILNSNFYRTKLQPIMARWMALLFIPFGIQGMTQADLANYFLSQGSSYKENLVKADLHHEGKQALVLARTWVKRLAKHILHKIHRVHFGLLKSETSNSEAAYTGDISEVIETQSRQFMAVPFVGKDTPSASSEFANPDVLIGLTILSYRLDGMRSNDLKLSITNLKGLLKLEASRLGENSDECPTSLLFASWVEAMDGRVKGRKHNRGSKAAELLEETSEVVAVLPLDTIDLNDPEHFQPLEGLLKKSPNTIGYFLFNIVFPLTLRSSSYQLVASGQHLGSDALFTTKVGFSGTPTSLLPPAFGPCHFEAGTDGQMFSLLVSPEVTSASELPADWTAESLVLLAARGLTMNGDTQDRTPSRMAEKSPTPMAVSAHRPHRTFHALIDLGALVTGIENEDAARILCSSLPKDFTGVAYFGAGDSRLLMTRAGMLVQALEATDIDPDKRFTFYDHTHTLGQDIGQDALAVALVTIGKDTNFRDLAQGVWRLRQLGQGQKIHIVIPPAILADMRRRRLCWNTANPTDVDYVVNWTMLNGWRQYEALEKLNQKQTCEHLLSTPLIQTVTKMEADSLSRLVPLQGSVQKMLVEGATGWIYVDGEDEKLSWLGQMKAKLADTANIQDALSRMGSETSAACYKNRQLLNREMEKLAAASRSSQSQQPKKSPGKPSEPTAKVVLAALLDEMSDDASTESESTCSEGEHDFDIEAEAEAEEEAEEEMEQEEEIEQEEEQQVVKPLRAVQTNLKYSRSKESDVHWSLLLLRNALKGENRPFLRQFKTLGINLGKASTIKADFLPNNIWATSNFHPQSWDGSLRRLTNILFVVEVEVIEKEMKDTTSSDVFAAIVMLFRAFKDGERELIDESSVWVLLKCLNVLDQDESDSNPVLTILRSLTTAKSKYSFDDVTSMLLNPYPMTLISDDPQAYSLPQTSLYGAKPPKHFVCVTLREAETLRALMHRFVGRSDLFAKIFGLRIALRNILQNFNALDVHINLNDSNLSLQNAEAYTCLRCLAGQTSLKPAECSTLVSVIGDHDTGTLTTYVKENLVRRRRAAPSSADILINAITGAGSRADMLNMLTLSANETSLATKATGRLLAAMLNERMMNGERLMRELIMERQRIYPSLGRKQGATLVDASDDTILDLDDTIKKPTVGHLLLWIKERSTDPAIIARNRMHLMALVLCTFFSGTIVTSQQLEKLIAI